MLSLHLHTELASRAVVFDDRKVPGTKCHLDHLVIAPSGVWVIDANEYDGRVERRDIGGWFKVDERLFVAGKDRTHLVDSIDRQVISVENDASWPLPILERMDDRWKHDQIWAPPESGDTITSGRKPSQIFHDQVAATFMRDRTAILSREIIGRRNIMWGSDYPHFDGAWPNSQAVLAAQFAGVPEEDQRRIGRTNAIEFYDLPIER